MLPHNKKKRENKYVIQLICVAATAYQTFLLFIFHIKNTLFTLYIALSFVPSHFVFVWVFSFCLLFFPNSLDCCWVCHVQHILESVCPCHHWPHWDTRTEWKKKRNNNSLKRQCSHSARLKHHHQQHKMWKILVFFFFLLFVYYFLSFPIFNSHTFFSVLLVWLYFVYTHGALVDWLTGWLAGCLVGWFTIH